MRRGIVWLVLLMLMGSCRGGLSTGSSVPDAPVQLAVNTRIFAKYAPANATNWFLVNRTGYHAEDGTVFQQLQLGDYYGYFGVFVVVGFDEVYYAYDLCCPNCLTAVQPDSYSLCKCDGCGEVYATDFGGGFPTKGISREGLKRYKVSHYNDVIHVYN